MATLPQSPITLPVPLGQYNLDDSAGRKLFQNSLTQYLSQQVSSTLQNLSSTVSAVTGAGFVTKTGAYTALGSDNGRYFICSGGSWTFTLPAPAAGLQYRLRNDMGISGTVGTITLQPTGGTIDGLASIPLLPQQECTIITDGTNWRTFGLKREVILGTQDITSSTASSTILLPVGYRMFELDFTAVLASADAQTLEGTFSIDGGASFLSTGYYHEVLYNNAPTTTAGLSGAGIAYAFLGYGGNTAGAQTRIRFYPGSSLTRSSWLSQAETFYTTGSFLYSMSIGGLQTQQSAPINALKYFFSSSNIANSFLTVKGVV